MDGGAWWAAVHGVEKSWTWLSDFTFTFHFPALEKEMATHSSVLAWRIPGTGEPGGLQSMGSHRVGHDWSVLAAAMVAWQCECTWYHWMVYLITLDFIWDVFYPNKNKWRTNEIFGTMCLTTTIIWKHLKHEDFIRLTAFGPNESWWNPSWSKFCFKKRKSR